ncbi:MAG: tetratricopeptide repeat protein [Alphaproteobacteria bacterium]|nr:tetratricopeptide repeat protein [Alphaproteobacteria bacterium]
MAEPGQIMISDTAHHSLDGKAVEDFHGGESHQLKNISRAVAVWRWPGSDGLHSVGGQHKSPVGHSHSDEKPVIAVLPFDNMSSDPEQEYFADGITEDIITVLSRFRNFSVIARNSSFTYKGQAVDMKQIVQELGANYVIEGSVRRAGQRLRITVQLIDAVNDDHIWAERYDRTLEDVFEVQDEITERVALAIGPEIQTSDLAHAQRKGTQDLSVWETFAKVAWHFQKLTEEDSAEAQSLLQELLQKDPKNAAAMAWLASIQTNQFLYGWTRPRHETLAFICENAQAAAAQDSNSEFCQTALGIAHMFSKRHEEAQARFRAALQLNPNHVDAISSLGMSCVYTHNFDAGAANIQKALELSPKSPFNQFARIHLGFMHFFRKEYEKAREVAEECLAENPNFPTGYRLIATAEGQLGNLEAAADAYRKFDKLVPNATITNTLATVMFVHQDDMDRYAEGLRRAGMPE